VRERYYLLSRKSCIKANVIANAVRYGTAKGEWFLNVVSFKDIIYINALRDLDITRPLFYPQEKSSRLVKDLASRLLGLMLLSYLLGQKGLLGLSLKVLFA
jgi:hypothetical protein